MSAIQLAPLSNNFGYQRLKHEAGSDEERDRSIVLNTNLNKAKKLSWFKLRRVPIRRRMRLKVPSLRRFWRKKGRLVSSLRVSYSKVMQRFRDGHVHLGDLFAGNYLFMQVNPASLKHFQKELSLSKIA